MVSKVLKDLTLTDLAKWTKIPYRTLQAYRLGLRTPPPATVRAIARALSGRAKELSDLAATLNAEMERNS